MTGCLLSTCDARLLSCCDGAKRRDTTLIQANIIIIINNYENKTSLVKKREKGRKVECQNQGHDAVWTPSSTWFVSYQCMLIIIIRNLLNWIFEF